MKYLSFFSGIGGFEVAIKSVYKKKAKCIGFSEIRPEAIAVYQHHYPDHSNLGDINDISEKTLIDLFNREGTCDLIVGGFPCTDLTVIANMSEGRIGGGLEGKYSCLLFQLLRIIKCMIKLNPNVSFIIENNASMSLSNKEKITNAVRMLYDDNGANVYMTEINNALFGVQTRRRLFWTNFPIDNVSVESRDIQKWTDVLEPLPSVKSLIVKDNWIVRLNSFIKESNKEIETVVLESTNVKDVYCIGSCVMNGRSRLSTGFVSDTCTKAQCELSSYPFNKSRPIIGINNIVLDRRIDRDGKYFYVRRFSLLELERLMMFDDGYTSMLVSKSKRESLLGNSVAVGTIRHIVESFKNK